MNPTNSLVFLSCGGTIEKIYFPNSGELGFDRSRVSDWVNTCRLAQHHRVETVMLMDSLEMKDSDRQLLADKVASTPESRIVILHGTDTMVESAKAVMLQRKENQVVVFTGAMVPASQKDSDAFFNLGLATAAAQILDPGVYIAMSGRVFQADETHKNRELGVFEPAPTDNTMDSGTLRITKRKITGFFR